MRRSPLRDFICVITLLTVMGIGIYVVTGKADAPPAVEKTPRTTTSQQVSIVARIIFSHRPNHLSIQQAGKDTPVLDIKPTDNEIHLPLTLPAKQITEFLIDIQWPEARDDSKYFTQITLRQDGKEDQTILFSDQYSDFADTFSIDTH